MKMEVQEWEKETDKCIVAKVGLKKGEVVLGITVKEMDYQEFCNFKAEMEHAILFLEPLFVISDTDPVQEENYPVRGSGQEKERDRIMASMRRIDDEEDSTIFCKCGDSFTWSGFNDRLHPWLDSHIRCYK